VRHLGGASEVSRFDRRSGWIAGADRGHHRRRRDCRDDDDPEASGADRKDRARHRPGCRVTERLGFADAGPFFDVGYTFGANCWD